MNESRRDVIELLWKCVFLFLDIHDRGKISFDILRILKQVLSELQVNFLSRFSRLLRWILPSKRFDFRSDMFVPLLLLLYDKLILNLNLLSRNAFDSRLWIWLFKLSNQSRLKFWSCLFSHLTLIIFYLLVKYSLSFIKIQVLIMMINLRFERTAF